MEAAGLASSILTFIDISFKIVKGAHELYKSASGSTSENNHIANVVLDLEKASGYLSIPQSGNKDTGLQSLVAQCQSLSRDLLELLDKLQVKDKTLFKSFAAAFANARKQKDIASIEHRLDQYKQQILLRLSLLFCQSQAPIRAQLEAIRKESNRLENKHASELEKTHAKMEEIIEALRGQQTDARPNATLNRIKESNQILDVVKFRGTGRGPTAPDIAVEGEAFRLNSQKSDASGGLADLANILSRLKPLYEAIRNENSVLSFLYFDDMFRREDTVQDASAETFAWMVQKPNPSDVELKQDGSSSDGESRRQGAASDETNSGSGQSHSSENSDVETSDADTFTRQERRRKLDEENLQRRMTSESFLSFLTAIGGGSYFITGKAGSGKSTLMKFLANHQRVAKHLGNWASGRKLIQVNIFFWNSGTALQKSLEGFYRTMLFHTLRQSPELIEEIFPPFTGTYLTESNAKRSPNLVQAFDRLVRVGVCSNHAFCFFIDGLDEYEGDTLDQRDLAGKLLSWSRADYVKIICSGRPYTAFLDVFQSNNPFVKLEHLTRADILNFALSQFEHHLEDTAFDGVRSACIEQAEMITDKAEGVFLWASLVVRSLLNAALDYEDETQIVRLLNECPTDLNGLFRRMLSNIHSSKTLRLRSNFIFNLVVQWWSESFGVNVLTLTWLSEFNWFQTASEFPFNVRKNPYDEQEIDRRVSIAQKQLHLLTQGLLEVKNPGLRHHAPFFASRIGFFHRSVIDFLKNEWLPKLDCGPFESIQGQAEVFCRLKLAEVKFAPRALSQATGHSYNYDILDMYKHFFDTLSTLRLKYGYQVPLEYIEDIEKNGCGNVTEDEILLPTPSNIGGSSIPVWLADVRSQNIRRLESMEMDT
ncbi:hypothetical protein CCHR01_10740 [Colletotrichum chrysophilum]|uniref:Nephrocystin 3-like N-terminal domain-containing protein n=1 Tax=Colletotrichum chrysophilum TaxID=1836956 RepID=A0AAD9AGR3_9PEZI|nr:hypothetical protein CCHR01_10740 [Colletotrichum chrysophilum]